MLDLVLKYVFAALFFNSTPLYCQDTLKNPILSLVLKLTKGPVHSMQVSKISNILVNSNFSHFS